MKVKVRKFKASSISFNLLTPRPPCFLVRTARGAWRRCFLVRTARGAWGRCFLVRTARGAWGRCFLSIGKRWVGKLKAKLVNWKSKLGSRQVRKYQVRKLNVKLVNWKSELESRQVRKCQVRKLEVKSGNWKSELKEIAKLVNAELGNESPS